MEKPTFGRNPTWDTLGTLKKAAFFEFIHCGSFANTKRWAKKFIMKHLRRFEITETEGIVMNKLRIVLCWDIFQKVEKTELSIESKFVISLTCYVERLCSKKVKITQNRK